MKKIYILLFFFLPSILFAQSNYYEGRVIKNNGDTVKGFINYREWTYSPKFIEFKVNKDDKQILSFNPHTIRGFQIDGQDTYVTYAGIISMDENVFPNLPNELDTSRKLDTVFLKQLETGKHLTLYSQADFTKVRFFLAEINQPPIELAYHVYYNRKDGENQIKSSYGFRGLLTLYINKYRPGNDKLISDAARASFTNDDLEPIINKINGSVNIERKKLPISRLFVGIGLNSTTTQVGQPNFINVVKTYNTIAPKLNLGIDLFAKPRTERLIVRTELSFTYVAPHYVFDGRTGVAPQNEYFSFNQYTASITPQLLYNLCNNEKFKLYLDAGAEVNISMYANNKYTIQFMQGVTNSIDYHFDTLWVSIPFQAGAVLAKKWEVYFTYIGYANFSSNIGWAPTYVNNKSMCIGLKYRLNHL